MSLIATLSGHSSPTWSLSWSPSSPLLASCSSDKSIKFYSYTPSLSFTLKLEIPIAHSRTIRNISFSPNGKILSSASFDSTVGIWMESDFGEGEGEWEGREGLEGHESECKSVDWSFDGRLLASCSRDKSVWIWEVIGDGEFECLAVLMDHEQDVKMVKWHPNSELLASASYDDSIKLYSADAQEDEWSCIETLKSHTGTIWSICFSPCGNYLISGGDDLSLIIWSRELIDNATSNNNNNIRIGQEKYKWIELIKLNGFHERTIYSIDWKLGGDLNELGRIITAGGDGTINIFQILKPIPPCKIPSYKLIKSISSAHQVSDINKVSWCNLSPKLVAKTLRKLEGGELDFDDDEVEEGEKGEEEVDDRWIEMENVFASCGDDGLIKIWKI